MPLLPKEPDLFPEDLLQQEDAGDVPWYVLHTLPRREKDLARRLLQMQIPFYAPVIERRTRSPQGRSRVSYVPLFPCYVFMRAGLEQRQQSLTTHCIARVLEVADAEQLVADLRQIQVLIQSKAALTPEARIEPGMRVRVRSGALAGLEGTVIKRRGSERLLVMVHLLQQGASVQLEDYLVERIDG